MASAASSPVFNVKNIDKVKTALSKLISTEQGRKKRCELCAGPMAQPSVFAGADVEALAYSFHAPLPPYDEESKWKQLKCSLAVCYECKLQFYKLTVLYRKLEEMRVEFNSFRMGLGKSVIEKVLGLSSVEWMAEIKEAEGMFPSCTPLIKETKDLKDVAVGTDEADLEDPGESMEGDQLEDRRLYQGTSQTSAVIVIPSGTTNSEAPSDNAEDDWSIGDRSMKIEIEEDHNPDSEREIESNMQVIRNFCASWNNNLTESQPNSNDEQETPNSEGHNLANYNEASNEEEEPDDETSPDQLNNGDQETPVVADELTPSDSSIRMEEDRDNETHKKASSSSGQQREPTPPRVLASPQVEVSNSTMQAKSNEINNNEETKSAEASVRRSQRTRRPINYKELTIGSVNDLDESDSDESGDEIHVSVPYSAELSASSEENVDDSLYNDSLFEPMPENYMEDVENPLNDNNETEWKCSSCPQTFRDERPLAQHVHNQHHNNSGMNPQVIAESKESNGGYSCPQCPSKFNLAKGLKTHVAIKHGSIEPKPLIRANSARIQERQQRKVNSLKLKKCRRSPRSQWALSPPARTVRTLKKKEHSCGQCGKKFLTLNSLKKHMSCSHSKKPTIRSLESHNLKDAPEQNEIGRRKDQTQQITLVLRCPYCLTSNLKNLSDMKSHMNKSHPREYETNAPKFCDVCLKCCKSALELQNHVKEHEDFKCPLCEKGFASKWNLKCHMRVHMEKGHKRIYLREECEGK